MQKKNRKPTVKRNSGRPVNSQTSATKRFPLFRILGFPPSDDSGVWLYRSLYFLFISSAKILQEKNYPFLQKKNIGDPLYTTKKLFTSLSFWWALYLGHYFFLKEYRNFDDLPFPVHESMESLAGHQIHPIRLAEDAVSKLNAGPL